MQKFWDGLGHALIKVGHGAALLGVWASRNPVVLQAALNAATQIANAASK